MDNTKLDLKQPYVWLATWLGCGFMKPAPGTWGSLGALPVGIILYGSTNIWGFILGIILVSLIGYWATERFEAATETHDNKMIVIDEVAGQWVALLPVFHFVDIDLLYIALSFLLFRLFDITKPWPVSHFDKNIEGALGVMGDDIIAGLFAAGCLIGLIYVGLG